MYLYPIYLERFKGCAWRIGAPDPKATLTKEYYPICPDRLEDAIAEAAKAGGGN